MKLILKNIHFIKNMLPNHSAQVHSLSLSSFNGFGIIFVLFLFSVLSWSAQVKDPVFFYLLKNEYIDKPEILKAVETTFKMGLSSKPGMTLIENTKSIPAPGFQNYNAETAATLTGLTGSRLIVLGSFEKTGPYISLTFGLFDGEKKNLIHETSSYVLGLDHQEIVQTTQKASYEFITGKSKFPIPAFVIWSSLIGVAGIVGYYSAMTVVMNKERPSEHVDIKVTW